MKTTPVSFVYVFVAINRHHDNIGVVVPIAGYSTTFVLPPLSVFAKALIFIGDDKD